MIIEFNRRFLKDLDKINRAAVKKDISEIITEIKTATNFAEIKNLKKLKGNSTAYRIRSGDYRFGLLFENNIVELVRVADRKEIYKVFP